MSDVQPDSGAAFDLALAKTQVRAASALALPYFLAACDEIDRLRSHVRALEEALREIIEEFRTGDGSYDEDDPVVIIARAALAPQPPYDDVPGAGS